LIQAVLKYFADTVNRRVVNNGLVVAKKDHENCSRWYVRGFKD